MEIICFVLKNSWLKYTGTSCTQVTWAWNDFFLNFLKILMPKQLHFHISWRLENIENYSPFQIGEWIEPIAILTFLYKVLEILITNQMKDYLTCFKILSECKFGFLKGWKMYYGLVDDLRSLLDRNMVSFSILLDHCKAFVADNHKILISKLTFLLS